jgi:hypothetical protein
MTQDTFDWSEIDLDRYSVDHTYFSDDRLALQVEEPPAVSTIPMIDRELASQPWDLAASRLPVSDPEHEIEPAELAPSEPAGYQTLDPDHVNPLIARFRKALRRALERGGSLGTATLELAVQLGDLLAASGNVVEALVAYREILKRLHGADTPGTERIAWRATAVLSYADLEPTTPVAAALQDLIPTYLRQRDDGRRDAELHQLKSNALRIVDAITSFDSEAADRLRVATGPRGSRAVAELESTVLTNASAARLQMAEVAALNDPLPVSVLGEAVLDSIDGLGFWAMPGWRGKQHWMRYADHMIIKSPLPEAAPYEEHVTAVLNAKLRSRPSVTLGDVVYYTGSFPEASEALLRQWRQLHRLRRRDVVINCPYLMRTRPENHDRDLGVGDRPAPQDRFSSLVLTSLIWGGAADSGALIARNWGWGFAAATRTQLEGHPETAFADWTDSLKSSRRHTRLAQDLLGATHTMLDALPYLSKRVYALDQPKAAIRALGSRPELGRADNPLPIVVITIGDRRIRWAARHMLSIGGRFRVTEAQIQTRTSELQALQGELVRAVQAFNSAATPALVVDMTDHLEDGYAKQRGNDPVDADFDCFADTAARIQQELETLGDAAD